MSTIELQEKLNNKLAKLFEEKGIRKFKITSLGNSIASGYSMIRPVKPLLLRNETLEKVMKKNNIKLERHHFARGQNNNDEHVFEWLTTNVKESTMHKMNKNDFGNTKTSMGTVGMTQQKLNKYYPTNLKNDKGLRDIIEENEQGMANIVVYNGCTGSFLDGVTRGGSIKQMLSFGIKRDTYGIEAVLKQIQSNNRNDNTNTQVYLCGAPDYLGIKINSIINSKLKKIADKYANVVYVEPVKANLIYKDEKEGKKSVAIDIHYSDEEYEKFNNNIINSIIDNYEITKSMINIDREIYDFNRRLELKDQEKKDDIERTSNYLFFHIIKETSQLEQNKKKDFLELAKKYLKERSPYDFFYVGKKNIENSLEKVNRIK